MFSLQKGTPDEIRDSLKNNFDKKMHVQPLEKRTLGCIFKNPVKSEKTAGELIDIAGLKGIRRGDALVSDKHGNFIVNSGSATFSDVTALIGDIQSKVKEKFSVELEPEIEILKYEG